MKNNRYINREISWLQFNQRVLQEAADSEVPLITRFHFLGVFSNNLDEFFMVRYATVKHIAESNKTGVKVLGKNAMDLLGEITERAILMQTESFKILENIEEELKKENIFIINETEVLDSQKLFLKRYFIDKISPALVSIILDDLDDFPILKDSAAYLAIKLEINNDEESKKQRYALIEIPRFLDRFIVLPKEGDKQYIMMLDDLIRYSLDNIFSIFDYTSISVHMIKITRDAKLDIESDLSKSFIEKISKSVEQRRKSEPVRLIYDKNIEKDTLSFLIRKMGIDKTDSIIPGGRYHYRRDYMRFPTLNRDDLLYEIYSPLQVKGLNLQGSILKEIAKKDYLQHTPYHTFSYIIRFLRESALDPQVRRIKITAYRLANISHIVSSLINAVKNGKDVTILIELKARFDETANIEHASALEAEGVKVIFGVQGLKVHSKICMIERQEESKKLKRYGFISTGNFNESSAKIYTDYTLFTANEDILKEINKVFNFFESNYEIYKYKHLIVSPHYTEKRFRKLIKQEIENAKQRKSAYIKVKMNSFSNYSMIDRLYEASRAGVKIQLIVRGICCLIPGVKGMSENIEVISIVDKYLEHSRLYMFCNDNNPQVYISSADWMTRNIFNRVEVSCPIYDENIKKELMDVFDISWKDNVKARVISEKQDNAYREKTKPSVRSQFEIYNYYKNKLED